MKRQLSLPVLEHLPHRLALDRRMRPLLGVLDTPIHQLRVDLGVGAAPRDRFIGWTPQLREKNLPLVVDNPRFLILPWIEMPNLGSHILAIIRRRLPDDWTERYNTTPVLIETFVETPRYTGAVYRASLALAGLIRQTSCPIEPRSARQRPEIGRKMADTTTAAKTGAKTEAKAGTKHKASTGAKSGARTETKDATATDAGSGKETESSTSDAPKGYSRGENQKLATDVYRKNWDDVFGKKPRRRSKK